MVVGLLLVGAAAGCASIDGRPETAPPLEARPATLPFVPPPPRPKPPEMTLPQLVGLSEEEVARLLGTADSLRAEPPATVWEYRSDTCALDLFFYMDMESQRFRALAYDVGTTDGVEGEPALSVCLKQIMDRRR